MMDQAFQSVLDPAGPQAAHIARLWWLMFLVCTGVFVIVMAFVAIAVARGRGAHTNDEERGLTLGVVTGVSLTIAILFVLLVASVWTDRTIASLGAASAVSISVKGHQWWWEIDYEDAIANRRVKTANDIHIPIGRPVVLKVTSSDVIHSFWVPNLHGKRDLVPGYVTAIWIQADRPGLYRGQCAEFCGFQHANMALFVTAENNDQFEGWLANQRKPAMEPETESQRHGREVFLATTCTQCHTIRGTIAGAILGPDLTHVGSRAALAAGTLPNTRGHLAGWIVDSQGIKPGNRMPPNGLAGSDLQALLEYMENLR